MSDSNWARYVRRISGDAGGSQIEQKTGIGQSNVSRWFTGTTPTPAHAAKFAQSYDGNVLEAFVAAGFLTREEAGMPPAPLVNFEAIVDDDEYLTDQAKIHLKNQYGLLKAASVNTGAAETRALIQNDPDLDDATKARLLAHFRGPKLDIVYSSTATVVERPFDPVSEAAGKPEDLIAADEQEQPISGEHLESETP